MGTSVEHISPEKMAYFKKNISLEDIKKLIEKRFL